MSDYGGCRPCFLNFHSGYEPLMPSFLLRWSCDMCGTKAGHAPQDFDWLALPSLANSRTIAISLDLIRLII